MVIYDNFLNTEYIENNIVIGNLRNFDCHVPHDKAFIVYCSPKCLNFKDFIGILRNPSEFKKYIYFNKKIMGEKINLVSVFNDLNMVLNHNVTSFTLFNGNQINIQKFFFPYYNENIVLQTKYWNLLTFNDFVTQLNILYETEEPITLENIDDLELPRCGINIELNYDLYCPYYKYPIRFVFQYTLIK